MDCALGGDSDRALLPKSFFPCLYGKKVAPTLEPTSGEGEMALLLHNR